MGRFRGRAGARRIVPFLEQSYERMLRPVVEVEADDRHLGPIKLYWDPVLAKNRRKFLSLMRALLRIGLVLPVKTGSTMESAALFFVRKPGKEKSRIIVDARRANRRFARPPSVQLSTAETFSKWEAMADDNAEQQLAMGVCDIKDAFHRFRLRRDLACYFGLGKATAMEVPLPIREPFCV